MFTNWCCRVSPDTGIKCSKTLILSRKKEDEISYFSFLCIKITICPNINRNAERGGHRKQQQFESSGRSSTKKQNENIYNWINIVLKERKRMKKNLWKVFSYEKRMQLFFIMFCCFSFIFFDWIKRKLFRLFKPFFVLLLLFLIMAISGFWIHTAKQYLLFYWKWINLSIVFPNEQKKRKNKLNKLKSLVVYALISSSIYCYNRP